MTSASVAPHASLSPADWAGISRPRRPTVPSETDVLQNRQSALKRAPRFSLVLEHQSRVANWSQIVAESQIRPETRAPRRERIPSRESSLMTGINWIKWEEKADYRRYTDTCFSPPPPK